MNEFEKINQRLDRIEHIALISAKNVLDIQEAATLTGLSVGHLYRLTSGQQIPHFKKSRKLYFKKSELEDWMLDCKVLTKQEAERQATTYTATHKVHKQ